MEIKKTILVITILLIQVKINAQEFTSLLATGSNKKIEWKTSNWDNGFGHKIYSLDPGGKTLLNIARRHNNSNWTDLMTFTSDGKIGIGTSSPEFNFHIKSTLLGETVNSKSILVNLESSVVSNNSKFQILNKRNSSGPNWLNTSLRLQRVVDATEMAFIDFGIEGKNGNYGLAFGTRNGFNGTQQTRMVIESDGKVGIGTSSPDMKLTVNGNIHAKEVKIDLNIPAPDYVFKKDYNLRSIEEVEEFIKENSHLPEISSAKEFEENGVMQAEMDMNLLKKIEELTLYTIQQEKKINKQANEIKELKNINNKLLELQSRLEKLESKK